MLPGLLCAVLVAALCGCAIVSSGYCLYVVAVREKGLRLIWFVWVIAAPVLFGVIGYCAGLIVAWLRAYPAGFRALCGVFVCPLPVIGL